MKASLPSVQECRDGLLDPALLYLASAEEGISPESSVVTLHFRPVVTLLDISFAASGGDRGAADRGAFDAGRRETGGDVRLRSRSRPSRQGRRWIECRGRADVAVRRNTGRETRRGRELPCDCRRAVAELFRRTAGRRGDGRRRCRAELRRAARGRQTLCDRAGCAAGYERRRTQEALCFVDELSARRCAAFGTVDSRHARCGDLDAQPLVEMSEPQFGSAVEHRRAVLRPASDGYRRSDDLPRDIDRRDVR